MTHVPFNSLSDNGNGRVNAEKIRSILGDEDIAFVDVIGINTADFVSGAAAEDKVILAGGDGTINHLINECAGKVPSHPLYYYATGTGNDFLADIKDREKDEIILLTPYLKNLPTVEIDGKKQYFFNGVGYGIDGYCCEVADKIRKKDPQKVINYPGIAIKGLLFHFKPRNAKVTVDGVLHTYEKVWLAPSMNGRYYGGGMNIAPAQDRLNEDGSLSVVIMHGSGKLKTLIVFPSIFKGEHIKHTEMVEILTGRDIKVEFNEPCALQIDGETVLGVSSYEARSADRCGRNTLTDGDI